MSVKPLVCDVSSGAQIETTSVSVSTKQIYVGDDCEPECAHECDWSQETVEEISQDEPTNVHLVKEGVEFCFDTHCLHCGISAYCTYYSYDCCFTCCGFICHDCLIKKHKLIELEHDGHDRDTTSNLRLIQYVQNYDTG